MRRLIAVVALALAATGCAQLLPMLTAASQGAQFVAALVDAADAGQEVYFAKHPHAEREAAVRLALKRARLALAALETSLRAGEALSAGELQQARTAALSAYGALRGLLDEFGILQARPPDGGAETTAPNPEPFELPPADQVAAMMGAAR